MKIILVILASLMLTGCITGVAGNVIRGIYVASMIADAQDDKKDERSIEK